MRWATWSSSASWSPAAIAPARAAIDCTFWTAADCLDFSDLGRSIFGRKKDLADATMRRIAKGVMRNVIGSAEPFIVPFTHQGGDRVHSVREPRRTITAANCGELMLAAPELAPFITQHANASNQRTMTSRCVRSAPG